jgi:hypothetical protein
MPTTKELKELRKKAEDAVADMRDGELKTKAFEILLQHLLAQETPNAVSQSGSVTEPTTTKQKKSAIPGTTKSRILLLKDEGFFLVPRSISEIKSELHAHGWILPMTTLSGPLQKLVQERQLRRIKEKKLKQGWKYVNP